MPVYVSCFIDLVISCGTTIMLSLLYKFYGCLAQSKQTVLTYLMESLTILWMAVLVWYNFNTFILNLIPGHTSTWFEVSPTIACSILSPGISYLPPLVLIFILLGFKAYMAYKPLHFIAMNHEQVFTDTMIGFAVFMVSEISLLVAYYGSLCQPIRLDILYFTFGSKFDKEKFNFMPPVVTIHSLLLFIPETVYRFIIWRNKKQKSR